jgi:hypothetical protein
VTFSATAVFNFPGVPFGLQPYHWFGLLLLITSSIQNVIWLPQQLKSSGMMVPFFLIFLFVATISALNSLDSSKAFIHISHILFGFLVMLAAKNAIKDVSSFSKVLEWLYYGMFAAAIWGLLQLLLFFIGVEYPAEIFNNSASSWASGYRSTILNGAFPRISSVATEPSFLVRSLVPFLFLIVNLAFIDQKIYGGVVKIKWVTWKSTFIIFTIIFSTSSVGFIGILLFIIFTLMRDREWNLKLPALAFLGFCFLVFVLQSEFFTSLFDDLLFNKLDTFSGITRISTVSLAWYEFKQFPFLGAGPGLITSDDLIVKLLSNFGGLGALLFMCMLGSSLSYAWRSVLIDRRSEVAPLIIALIGANVLLWALDALAGVSYQYGIFWILLSLMLSISRLQHQPERS